MKYFIGSPILLLMVFSLLTAGCKNNTSENSHSGKDIYASEQHRPLYHFTPDSMWMNDPNGMVYHDGEYHLFYQYYPDSTVWGPMHWGHAVSKDLVQWQHLPVALYPDSLGYIFSGSAVVDKGNTSGFGKDGKDPIVAIFTHHNMDGEKSGRNDFQYQSLAYSNDNGRTFTKYEGNPVIKNPGIKDFRDPKVIWYEAEQKWVMVFAAYDKVLFYTSPDLKEWTKTGEFGIAGDKRLWECPDLFPIKTEDSNETKWILITSIQQQAPNGGTATSYFVGDFDGKTFKGDPKLQRWLDFGTDNYALVTWSNAPDGRIVGLGWMSNWQYAQVVPTQRWRSAMTLPRELKLYKQGDDYVLRSMPVKELASLETDIISMENRIIKDSSLTSAIPSASKLEFSFKKPKKGLVTIRFSNSKNEYLDVGYDAERQTYFVDRTKAGKSDFNENFAARHTGQASYKHENIDLLIYLDHASVELFADNGQCVMTEIFFPSQPFHKVQILGDNIEWLSGNITALEIKKQ